MSYPGYLDEISYTQKRLDQLKVGCQQRLPSYVAQTVNFEVDSMVDFIGKDLIFRLNAYVLSDHLVHDVQAAEYQIPATWWQHFKRDHMPEWFKRRWPVRFDKLTHEFSFERYATYPDAGITPPQFGRSVIYEEVRPLPWYKE